MPQVSDVVMDPVAPTAVASATAGLQGVMLKSLHNSDSPAYWTHDVHGPTGFEHGGAHASITGFRDEPTLSDNALEGHNALGVSSYWR